MSQGSTALSVIIPVYAAGPDFTGLITALSGQKTDFNYEVVIADDASPDDTFARIERHLRSLSKPFIKLVRLPKNSGPAGARNFAISRAQGEVFLLIDADCKVISQDYLARAYQAHKQYSNAIIGGGVQGQGEGPIAFADRYCHWSTNIPGKSAVITGGHLVTANMIIPRKIFEKIGPLDPLRTGEDSAFCFRARNQGIELRLHGDLVVAHQDRENLADFLSCLYWVGRDRADSRKAAYGRAPWFLKAPASWILSPLIAAGLTAKNFAAWWPYDKKVLAALPLIVVGMCAIAAGVAVGPRLEKAG